MRQLRLEQQEVPFIQQIYGAINFILYLAPYAVDEFVSRMNDEAFATL